MAEVINVKWEYKAINLLPTTILEQLNIEGQDGWELVQIMSNMPSIIIAIFKRAVIDKDGAGLQ